MPTSEKKVLTDVSLDKDCEYFNKVIEDKNLAFVDLFNLFFKAPNM